MCICKIVLCLTPTLLQVQLINEVTGVIETVPAAAAPAATVESAAAVEARLETETASKKAVLVVMNTAVGILDSVLAGSLNTGVAASSTGIMPLHSQPVAEKSIFIDWMAWQRKAQ